MMTAAAVWSAMETPELRALIEQAQRGETAAKARLYQRYRHVVMRYIRPRVGNFAIAEDLAQDVWVNALRNLHTFEWQGHDIGAWLIAIARNLITDHFRSGRYRMEVLTSLPAEPPIPAEPADHHAIKRQNRGLVLAALADLNPDQRTCLALRFLHGLSLAETASRMDRSIGAVKALQHRASQSLCQVPEVSALRD